MTRKPYKFDEIKRDHYLELVKGGMRRGMAAEAVGMSRAGVWEYRKKHPRFQREESLAEMAANEQVEDALFQAAISGNVVACQVWLYNRQPDRWMDKRNLAAQITGTGGGPVVIKVIRAGPRPQKPDDEEEVSG